MSNLLDKASIILTPTAYNNGEALCVKPSDGSGDFDFSRNSAATRVNAQGLVENVQILSSNLVQNGDFSEEGAEEVSNGSFSQEGVEEITNGNFDTDSDWSGVGSNGFSISGGKLNLSDVAYAKTVTQGNVTIVGKTYKVTFEISDYVKGAVRIFLGGSVTPTHSSNGVFTSYVTVSANTAVGIQTIAGGGTTLSIDNVSVREVGQDWDIVGTGWSFGEDKIVSVNGSNYGVHQSAIVSGKTYKITYEVKDYVSGNFSIRANTVSGSVTASANGTYTDYITSNGNFLRLMGNGAFNGSVTNISVKEVGQNWNLGYNWSIGNGVAICNVSSSFLSQNNILLSNKKYKISFEITEYISGEIRAVSDGYLNTSEYFNSLGVHDFIFNCGTLTSSTLFFQPANFNGSITNISVIEITDDTNLPRINYEGFSFDGSGNVVPDSGCGSWLFEPQSTNLITQSELFSDASWLKSDVSIIDNQTISPNGILSSDKLIEGSGNINHQLYRAITSVQSNNVYTLSLFAKKAERNVIQIGVGGTSFLEGSIYVNFDLTNGSIGNGNYLDAKIDMLQNDWYKCSVSFTTISTSNFNVTIQPKLTSSSSRNLAYQGDGTSGIYIWGAQLEEQSYATSYIPTEGSTVTRNQDVCTNGGSLASINSTEGVLYAEIAALANSGTYRSVSLSNGTNANRVNLTYSTASNILLGFINVNGVNTSFTFTVNPITDFVKCALKYKNNDCSLWVNGVEISNSTSQIAFPINTLTKLSFTSGSSSSNFFGKTKALAVWKEALSDSELQSLTTI